MQIIETERNEWNFFCPATFSISWHLALLPFALALGALSAAAQQPVQPLPKVGSCPLGYYSSGSYCVPSRSGNTRGALEKSVGSCPLGFYSSGSYCVSSPSNNRQAIPKQGSSCPLGWFSSGGYCVQTR
jgi:hypothetical protein